MTTKKLSPNFPEESLSVRTVSLQQPYYCLGTRFRHVKGKKVLIVTNETIAPLYLDRTIAALTRGRPDLEVESVILPDGEQYKNMVSEEH